jgi:predicted metal-dependent hydrolase
MIEISLGGKKYSYSILRKPILSLRLRLKTPKSFVVSCPRLTPEFVINRFIKNNQNWIIKHSQKVTPKKMFKSFKKLIILGKTYELQFINTQRDSVIISTTDKKIYVNTSNNTNKYIRVVLEKKLRPLALKLIKQELELLSLKYNFNYNNVTVRNQTSRFGSCSSRSNLNFNWQIIFFPPDKFRHILLHELSHLKIKNHSNVFWNQLSIYDPDCKSNNLWLKKEGTKLFLF